MFLIMILNIYTDFKDFNWILHNFLFYSLEVNLYNLRGECDVFKQMEIIGFLNNVFLFNIQTFYIFPIWYHKCCIAILDFYSGSDTFLGPLNILPYTRLKFAPELNTTHICGKSPPSIFLHAIQKGTIKLIGDQILSISLDSLIHRRTVSRYYTIDTLMVFFLTS